MNGSLNWSAIRFDLAWPVAVLVVCLLPALVFAAVHHEQQRRHRRLARYAADSALGRLGARPLTSRGRAMRLTVVALLAAVALTGPRWGMLASQETRRGIDLAVALDASLSMMARDERPSRLERMKQEVRRLRASSRADRMALIAFAGRSYILSPLTADDGALELYLETLTPDVVGQAGSSIARAIRQGTELLGASTGTSDRALVIMSDGEAFEPVEDVRAAAAEAAEQGIVLITVGFGTEDGSTIPETVGNSVREKRDDQGQVVVTRYMSELLAAAAEASGGVFISSDVTDRAGRVRAALGSLRTERRAVSSREDHVTRFTWFLVPALLLLLYDTWLGQRPARRGAAGRKTTTGGAASATSAASAASPVTSATSATSATSVASVASVASTVAAAMLFALVLPGCARDPDPAQRLADGDVMGAVRAYEQLIIDGDTTYQTRYNLGTALLAADSLDLVHDLLESVRRGADGELRARARYNAGLAHLQQALQLEGDSANASYAAALSLFRSYLGERHADEDGKWNYELALRQKPPSDGGGGGGGDSDDSDANEQPQDADQQPGQLDQSQAEALLNAAARDERDVQGRKQRTTRQPPPPGGRDW